MILYVFLHCFEKYIAIEGDGKVLSKEESPAVGLW